MGVIYMSRFGTTLYLRDNGTISVKRSFLCPCPILNQGLAGLMFLLGSWACPCNCMGTRHGSFAEDIHSFPSHCDYSPCTSLIPTPQSKHPNKAPIETSVSSESQRIMTCCSLAWGAKHIFALALCPEFCDSPTVARPMQIISAGNGQRMNSTHHWGSPFWPNQSSSERLLKRYNLALHSKYGYSARWSVLLNLCAQACGRPNKFSTHTHPASFKFRAVKF